MIQGHNFPIQGGSNLYRINSNLGLVQVYSPSEIIVTIQEVMLDNRSSTNDTIKLDFYYSSMDDDRLVGMSSMSARLSVIDNPVISIKPI